MHVIRRRLLWLAVLIGCALLFVHEPGPEHHRLWRRFWDSGHLWLFAGIGFLVARRWLREQVWLRGGIILVLTAIAGWLIELLQYATGRDYSLRDVAADTVGMALGMLVARWHDLRLQPKRAAMAAGIVAALLATLLLPIATAAVDAINAARRFPELVNFVTGPLPSLQRERLDWIASSFSLDEGGLRIDLRPAPYSGFFLDDFPTDWRGRQMLHVTLLNPGPARQMTCRLHDVEHERRGYHFNDRYNGRHRLAPGANHWRIPLAEAARTRGGRQLDLGSLRVFGCFVVDLHEHQPIVLQSIWLE